MAPILLVICVFCAWVLSITVDGIPHFLGLLVPSRWLVLGVLLACVTWLMGD
jgi:hypothetical protein